MGGWGGGPCDFSVSPSPFGLDFGTLDFGTSDLGLTKIVLGQIYFEVWETESVLNDYNVGQYLPPNLNSL